MNVQPIHVTWMVLVRTPLGPSNVLVIKATVEMALFALVCKMLKLIYPFQVVIAYSDSNSRIHCNQR